MASILGTPELQGTDSADVVAQNVQNLLVEALSIRRTVANDSLSAPPGSGILRGAVYIVAGTASGLWTGQPAGTVAVALSAQPTSAAGWFFYTPTAPGITLYVAAPVAANKVWNGTAWVAV